MTGSESRTAASSSALVTAGLDAWPSWVIRKSYAVSACGKYTSVAQTTVNTVQAPNLVRSAIAPLISATVMTANVSWKAENKRSGRPDTRDALCTSPCSPRYSKPPMNQLPWPEVGLQYRQPGGGKEHAGQFVIGVLAAV